MNMNSQHLFVTTLIGLLLSLSTSGAAQISTKPDHRFAVRLNLLGILSLSQRLEVEYSPSKRLGCFAGTGFGKGIMTDPFGVNIYRRYPFDPYCRTIGGSAYVGVNLRIPVWKLIGLSFKAAVIGRHTKTYSTIGRFGCDGLDMPHMADPYFRNSVSMLFCVAYAQSLGKHVFVEPLVGIGPLFTSLQGKREPDYLTYSAGMQLNVGVRF